MSNDDEKVKVNVLSKDGAVTVLTGPNYVQLQDISVAQYSTTSIADFVEYLKKYINVEWPIFITERGCQVYNPEAVDKYTIPEAVLFLSYSSYIDSFSNKINANISIDAFEKFLRSMLDFAGENVIKLYDFCRNLDIKSITQIRRAVDNQGNYAFAASRQGQSEENLPIPDHVTFEIPIYNLIPNSRRLFSFSTSLDYCTDKGEMSVSLCLMHFTWKDALMDACKDIIFSHFAELENPKFWGTKSITSNDDKWRYHSIR